MVASTLPTGQAEADDDFFAVGGNSLLTVQLVAPKRSAATGSTTVAPRSTSFTRTRNCGPPTCSHHYRLVDSATPDWQK
jgi:hypothetical protein